VTSNLRLAFAVCLLLVYPCAVLLAIDAACSRVPLEPLSESQATVILSIVGTVWLRRCLIRNT
jgi:hypothetical protein